MFPFFFFQFDKGWRYQERKIDRDEEKLELMVNNFSNFVDWIKLIACEQMHSFRFLFV